MPPFSLAFLFLVFVSFSESSDGLWVKKMLGVVKSLDVHVQYNSEKQQREKMLIVTTETPSIASIGLDTGGIIWRQLLPEGEIITTSIMSSKRKRLVTLSNGRIVRSWRVMDGRLDWEDSHSDRELLESSTFLGDLVFVKEEEQLLVLKLGALVYRSLRGQTFWRIELEDHNFSRIVTHENFIYLLGSLQIDVVDLNAGEIVESHELEAQSPCVDFVPRRWSDDQTGDYGLEVTCVTIEGEAWRFELSGSGKPDVEHIEIADPVEILRHPRNLNVFSLVSKRAKGGKKIYYLASAKDWTKTDGIVGVGVNAMVILKMSGKLRWKGQGQGQKSRTSKLELPSERGRVKHVFPFQQGKVQGVVTVAEDASITCFLSPKAVWTREEGLSQVSGLEILPLKSGSRLVEECKSETGDCRNLDPKLLFKGNQVKRLVEDLKYAVELGVNLVETGFGIFGSKDRFGFKKLALVWSETGKLYGLESDTGEVLYGKYPFDPSEGLTPIKMHIINEDQVLLLAKPKGDGPLSTFLVDPQDGKVIQKEEIEWSYPFLTSFVIPRIDDESPKTLLLVNENLEIQVFPKSEKKALMREGRLYNSYFSIADREQGTLIGYRVTSSGGLLSAEQVWNMVVNPELETLTTVAGRQDGAIIGNTISVQKGEKGKEEVYYKYLNPHLLVVCTTSIAIPGRAVAPRAVNEAHLNVYLVDGVTGRIFDRLVHKHGVGPVAAIQVENRVVYSFFNAGTLESVIVVHDLFEDTEEYGVNTSPSFSSYLSKPPMLVSQAFNYAGRIVSLQMSRTKHGITKKVILAVLSNGNVFRLDSNVLDPRRPMNRKPTQEEQMEGLKTYQRHIPSPPQLLLNKHERLGGIREVTCSGTELESTSEIVGYGVDIFSRRFTAANAFDMLSPDFNYVMLFGVVGGVSIGIFVASQYADSNQLAAAWKSG